MDRANNYIYYFLVVAIIGLAAFFFHSYLLATVVIVFAVLPIISAVLLRLSYKGISVSLKDNSTTAKRDSEYLLKIIVKNKSFIPVPFCNLQLDMVNDFSGENRQGTLMFRYHALVRELQSLDLSLFFAVK